MEADATNPVDLLYVSERRENLLYRDEIEALARQYPRFRFATSVYADSVWEAIIEEVTRRWIEGDADRSRQFYICGVGAGVIEVRDKLRSAGYERRSVHYEKW